MRYSRDELCELLMLVNKLFQIEIDTVRRRTSASQKLRSIQGMDDLVTVTSFIVNLPDDISHSNHITGEVSSHHDFAYFSLLFSKILQSCGCT